MTKPSSDILSLSHICERVRSFLFACWPFHLGHMKWNLFASPILTTRPKPQSSTKTYCLRQGSRNLLPPAHCLSLGGVLADSPPPPPPVPHSLAHFSGLCHLPGPGREFQIATFLLAVRNGRNTQDTARQTEHGAPWPMGEVTGRGPIYSYVRLQQEA